MRLSPSKSYSFGYFQLGTNRHHTSSLGKSVFSGFPRYQLQRFPWNSASRNSNTCIWRLIVSQLQGEIHNEIGNLQNLTWLSLGSNQLTGSVPLSLFNISPLQRLVLTNNSLSGNLPVDICLSLPELTVLALSDNEFDGQIPLGFHKCSKLQILSLSFNKFSGVIPRKIVKLTILSLLYLGEIPEEIGNLHNLEIMDAQNCSLSGPLPSSISNLTSLQSINLYGNKLSGTLPRDICLNMPDLRALDLGNNLFRGSIPKELGNCNSLSDLFLRENNLIGELPREIGSLPPDTGLGLPNLEELYLGYNNLTGAIANSLSNASNIFRLGIGYNNFSGPFPRSFGYNPLDGNLPASVGNLSSSLDYVYAAYSEIKGSIPSEIGNLSGLDFLFLQGNYLSGFIPRTIGNLDNLQALNLYDNKMISGPIPEELCNLKNLGFLSLGYNELCCSIPACLGNITSLRYIYLNSNKLTFSIPPSLWNLNDLLHLDMSSNFLRSSLPPEIGNLKVATKQTRRAYSGVIGEHGRLGIIGLAHNKLSGGIPKSLVSLSHLNYLNVSYNRLSGEIPTGGPFANFSYDSFLSNEALCGASRLQIPACRSRKRKTIIASHQVDSSPATVHGRVSYHDLQQATNGFSTSNLLGSGSYGSVYKATFGSTIVAVKVFNLQMEGAFYNFDTECEVLRNLRHRNLTKVINSCSRVDFKALVLDLREWIKQSWLQAMDEIIDPELMIPEENKTGKVQCLSSIMELALRCTADMPEERVNIKHVLAQLKTLKTMLENVITH
ncbi:hypothetical protein RND71_020163 [Anisodus tanguticus]|uniref:Protein kinase domain-containing protein n=1 Tax=Anisodus tanguticus TaxID=243964 RepID=A0AAE1VF39_9SOLA|nr:hypothetical protein RND71_020163 [Anisodus tanguticus]